MKPRKHKYISSSRIKNLHTNGHACLCTHRQICELIGYSLTFTSFFLIIVTHKTIDIQLAKWPVTKLLNYIGSIDPVIIVNVYMLNFIGHEMYDKIATITRASLVSTAIKQLNGQITTAV